MSTIPVNQSDKMLQSFRAYDLAKSGTPIIQNPVLNPGNYYGDLAAAQRGQLIGMQNSLNTMHPAYYLLGKIDSTIGQSIGQVMALVDHTNMLINGGAGGSIISGGLQANLGLAMSAITLDNTLSGMNGTPPSGGNTNPCQIVSDMFGSILGAGQALLGELQNLLGSLSSMITSFIQTIASTINEAMNVITDALSGMMEALESTLSEMRAVIDNIAEMIASEISQFGEWLSNQINFGLSSFLSGMFDDPCFRMVVNSVGTGALLGVLSTTPTAPITPAAAPGLWSNRNR